MGSAASNLVDAGSRGSDNPTTSVSKSFVEGSQRIRTRVLIDLVSLLSNVDWKRFASAMVRKMDLPAQAVMRWFRDQDQSVSAETGSVTGIGKKATMTRWDSLRNDLQANVLQRVDFLDRFSLEAVSSGSKKFIESDVFRQSRGGVSEGTFTAIDCYIKNNVWRCSGYDLHSKSWWSFSTVSYLPPPGAELFKEYSVCGHGGLMCAEVSKSPTKGELVVFNPLTGESQALPPLLHPRNPVLVHISVDSAKKSYKVIVAGSSAASDEHLSRKVEVFDSSTSKWKEVCDLPGPAFGLNEHQAGVCLNGNLFFFSFLEGGGRGVVALDVENGKWLQDLTVPIPWSSYSNTLQLVQSDGKLFVFSEQQRDHSVDHCIDEVEFQNPKAGLLTCRWRSFVKVKKSGGRGLQVYPEHTCVGFREEKPRLGIFSPLSRKKFSPVHLFDSGFLFVANDSYFYKVGLLISITYVDVGFRIRNADYSTRRGVVCSMRIPLNAWESPDFAKKAAVTLLVFLTMIGGRFAWGIFRGRQAPGNRFDIMQGLEASDIPTRGNPLFAILPDLPA